MEEERTLSDPEDKGVERNSFKERPDVPAGHNMISYPNCGQAFHPNFDAEVSTEAHFIVLTCATSLLIASSFISQIRDSVLPL